MSKFETKSLSELEAMNGADVQAYFEAKKVAELEAKKIELEGSGMNALETKAALAGLETKLALEQTKNLELKTNLTRLAGVVEGLQKAPKNLESKSAFMAALESKTEGVNPFTSEKSTIEFEVKATALTTHGNIVETSDFADMRPGVIDQPKRRLKIQDLFSKVKISKDIYKYTEQTSVVRDGRQLAYNTTFADSTTAETLTVSTIEPKIIKALMDISTDLIKDFPYMQGRSEKLVNETVAYKVDEALIVSDGVGTNVKGILAYAAEFDSADTANAGTPLEAVVDSIEDPNLIDLVLSMEMQISVHGEEHDYQANTLLMHRSDWFKQGGMLKDSTGRYLDERVQRNGTSTVIDGIITLVTSNNVPQGTMVVMDTTKGEIIDRDALNVSIAYENGTKWEQEIATMKGYVRLNLLIANENAGAFQKCTDIPAALIAIGTVPV